MGKLDPNNPDHAAVIRAVAKRTNQSPDELVQMITWGDMSLEFREGITGDGKPGIWLVRTFDGEETLRPVEDLDIPPDSFFFFEDEEEGQ